MRSAEYKGVVLEEDSARLLMDPDKQFGFGEIRKEWSISREI
jgi:hypothetical protein